MPTRTTPVVAVYGASGHTGSFVFAELARRRIRAVPVGRRAHALPDDTPLRVAEITDPAALARAFADCAAVVNCAGPFLDTATPVLRAALEVGAHYIDVTAEQACARATLRDFHAHALARGVAVVPAAGFFGGLADLLTSALAAERPVGTSIDAIAVAIALDHWWPTPGTRATGARNTIPRVVVRDGGLSPLPADATARDWDFGPPEGVVAVECVPLSETITIAHHLPVRTLDSYLGADALRDLRDPATTPPQASDASGRSAQCFAMQVRLHDGAGTRQLTARGRDIYAVSAPLVAETVERLLRPGAALAGAITLGQAFDARAVLRALAPAHFSVEASTQPAG